jgi:hypothetical protein
MRVVALISSVGIAIWSGAATAQTWTNYLSRDMRVAIDFPGQPAVKDVVYTTRSGATLPARQVSLEGGTSRYILTVVYFPTGPTADEPAVEHAAEVLRRRGTVRVAGADAYDPGIPGRQLSIVERDGRLLLATIYMYDRRLYIAEGSVAPGAAPPVQFQQSLTLVDANGNELDFDNGGPRGGR